MDLFIYKKLIETSSEGILLSKPSGNIVYANASCHLMFGYAEGELRGKEIEILIPKGSRGGHIALRRKYDRNPVKRSHGMGLDVYGLRKDGSTFPVEISLTPFRTLKGSLTASIIANISERKEKERKIQDFIAEQEKIKHSHTQAQLAVLKNQIGPHYLFNCLSILYTMIGNSPNDAEPFIKKILDTYGYVLETGNKQKVEVKDEIGFVRNYIYIQKMRFGNGFVITIDERLMTKKKFLYPLSLQGLIENVFKHNSLSEANPLKIEISLVGEGISVHNTILPRQNRHASHGLGLSNLMKQYELVSLEGPKIQNDGTNFKVWLPFLNH